MLHKSRGILLHHFRYGEKSIILKVFTLEEGLQSFFLYKQSSKSKIKGALEPLSIIEIVANKDEKRDFLTVKEIHVEHPYRNIGSDFLYNTVALFINEILVKTIRDHQPNEELFYFIREWLIHYDAEVFDADAHLLFLAHLTRFFGIFPDTNNPNNHSYFNLQDGKFCYSNNGNPRVLEAPYSTYFIDLFTLENWSDLNRQNRKFILHTLLEYYSLHIPAFGEVKSLPVLEELMK